MNEKELIIHIRLLDLYKIDKIHKDFLNYYKNNNVAQWYKLGQSLINRYCLDRINKIKILSKRYIKKTNKHEYLKAYKKFKI